MSFLLESYQIVLDRAVDTPGHGKDIVGGFNAVKKQYLSTCLIRFITHEVENIGSERMRADAMTNKEEVRFAETFKHLLDIRYKIGTNGNNKHVKREAKARLKHKYYWVHKE